MLTSSAPKPGCGGLSTSCARRIAPAQVPNVGFTRTKSLNDLAQRCVFGPGLLPWSWGTGAFGLVRNLTKNLFALMQFRLGKALGACALWLFLNLMPLIGAIRAPGWAKVPYIAALAALAAIYVGMARRTSVPAWTFLFHPLSALLIVYTMLRSIAHTWRHRGVVWRGTRYELKELRKGMV